MFRNILRYRHGCASTRNLPKFTSNRAFEFTELLEIDELFEKKSASYLRNSNDSSIRALARLRIT